MENQDAVYYSDKGKFSRIGSAVRVLTLIYYREHLLCP